MVEDTAIVLERRKLVGLAPSWVGVRSGMPSAQVTARALVLLASSTSSTAPSLSAMTPSQQGPRGVSCGGVTLVPWLATPVGTSAVVVNAASSTSAVVIVASCDR